MLELSHMPFCKTQGVRIVPAATIKGPFAGVTVGLEEHCHPCGDLYDLSDVPAWNFMPTDPSIAECKSTFKTGHWCERAG